MARHSHPFRWRLGLAGLAAGLGVASALTAADQGYLPAVGPPPLRFVAPRPSAISPLAGVAPVEPTTNARVSPAIPASTNVSPDVAQTEPKPTSAAPTAPEWFGPPAPPLPPPTPAPTALPPINPAWLIPDASQTVMPQAQLFLQYFTPDYLPGTNAGGLVVPVGFVPPQPRPSSSSSATYQVTPGGTGTTVSSGSK